nr:hypothetical protein CFP56_68163 [Quercus suber]
MHPAFYSADRQHEVTSSTTHRLHDSPVHETHVLSMVAIPTPFSSPHTANCTSLHTDSVAVPASQSQLDRPHKHCQLIHFPLTATLNVQALVQKLLLGPFSTDPLLRRLALHNLTTLR